ncbi:glutamate receptor ionotropic, kainate 2-like isoform X2 [Neocloeon triangulifer]|uniref:glutamate receptor ionotropic, kainate 2-like isoform X2 n=1 Tax=Neocloeon triangulifer TaxID=2078957 RepID=UPI00286F7DE8|nr:glutamate receptor ionotropic, kainate 2-like isoform X2 [Neocloeon triangulifer]
MASGRAFLLAGLFLGLTAVGRAVLYPDLVHIGGLFHPEDSLQEIAFRYAVDRVNMDRVLLPKTTLVPIIEHVPTLDSFKTAQKVCNLASRGVAAIFGPQSRTTAGMVQSICNNKEIPHIQTHWEPRELPPNSVQINMYPEPHIFALALKAVVRDMGWKTFTVLYQHNEALIRLQEVLKDHGPSDSPITVRQLEEGNDYRPLLKQVQASSESHIILDCDTDKILEILQQAKEVKMMEDYQSYFIISMDLHTVDLEEFRYGRTNITSLRILDPTSQEVQNVVQDWIFGEMRKGRVLTLSASQTDVALMYDAVHLFARALHDLSSSQRINIKPLSCDKQETWPHGYSLINYMRVMETKGLTGPVRFDNVGLRTDFTLDLIEWQRGNLVKTAAWDPQIGINHTMSDGEIRNLIIENLQNKTFIVSSRIGAPYLMFRPNADKLTGNERFEGYSIDLIDEISQILGFKYEFQLVPDGRYGSYNPNTKKWDGLVKQLLERKADLAICDLTITYERETAVDFTMPFMNLGISILYSKPVKQPPNLFSFLSPLSVDVWLYMATAYLGVSVILFLLARLAPNEWQNPHPCNPEPDELEAQFNMPNSLWFTIGSLMQQGCDFLPKAVSTRMVAGMWWFFTLIMISSYTANLAAFLTVERMDATIESAEDLAKQTKIKYGAVSGGSTLSFFSNSNFSLYQKMWSFMESTKPSVFVSSNGEGVERVAKSKRTYAFFMESTSIEYVVERNCDLQQVGGLLDSKGYGVAMPLNSPYRTAISGAVLKLQEEGKLLGLKTKWWKEMHGGGACQQNVAVASAGPELGLANVGGVFVVLIGGMVGAFFVAVLEFLWNTRKVAVEERANFLDTLKEEIKFALDCSANTKPVRKPKSHNQSPQGSSTASYDKLQQQRDSH